MQMAAKIIGICSVFVLSEELKDVAFNINDQKDLSR